MTFFQEYLLAFLFICVYPMYISRRQLKAPMLNCPKLKLTSIILIILFASLRKLCRGDVMQIRFENGSRSNGK